MNLSLIWFSLTFASFSSCANILVFSSAPAYSQQMAFLELWIDLSLRGHNVTLVTPNPVNNPKLTNLTEIDVGYSRGVLDNVTTIAQFLENSWTFYGKVAKYTSLVLEMQIQHPKFKELIDGKGDFDLVMVNYQYPQLLLFGKIYNCPTILFSTFYLSTYHYHAQGNPSHPAAHTDMMVSFHPPLTFRERFISTMFSLQSWHSMFTREIPEREDFINTHFSMSASIDELVRNVDLVFVSTHPAIHGARAFGPATVEVGYERKPKFMKPLEMPLKTFLDNAQDGFVYFSLGSNVKSKNISRILLKTIMEAIKEIPCTFLYKYEEDYLDDKPENVKLIKWAPQYHILKHHNIKLFVTQGGFQSTEEAIYSAVPMVVIPFFADQEYNAKLMESKGIAKAVNRKSLKKEDLIDAVMEVLNNSSYRQAITQLRELALDVPMTGLEKAIWWVEYVLRNKGAKHLRNPAADVPLYQYYLLDVIGFFMLLAGIYVTISYFLVKTIVNKIAVKLRKCKKNVKQN